jgi:hypothetical protein
MFATFGGQVMQGKRLGNLLSKAAVVLWLVKA